MSRRICAGILACGLLFAGASARAHDAYGESPFYFGFGLGIAGADEDCDYHGYNCDGSDTSFKILVGKRFHENLGFEVSFQDLGKIRDRERARNLTTTAESEGVNFSLLGIIPVEGIGYFYGKAGYMLWDTEYTRIDANTERIDDDGSEFTYGMGFAFQFARKYDIRVEYERLNELGDEFVDGGDPITVFTFSGSIYFD